MKRTRALLLLALVACGSAPPPPPSPPPPTPAPPLPALDVKRVLHSDDDQGFVKEGSSFAVVLTRAVEPAPNALALVDHVGNPVPGKTVWLDRQLVAFYPDDKLDLGLQLVLQLTVPLRASDGTVLAPRVVAQVSRRPITLLSSHSEDVRLLPMGTITLSFERNVPASDVMALGALSVDGAPLAFEAVDEFQRLGIRAVSGFPPARDVRLAWKTGPVALTSVGNVALDAVIARAKRLLEVRVGEHDQKGHDEHCLEGVQWHFRCKTELVHVVFSAPITDEELAKHVHPRMTRATTGDLRDHRFELRLGKKIRHTIVLDGDLRDTFGQKLGGKGTTLQIEHAD